MGPINPFEAAVFLAVCTQGIAILTGVGDSSSVKGALAPTWAAIWATLYAVGGAFAFAGYVWVWDRWTGVEIKRVGLVAVGFGGLIYSLAAACMGTQGVPTAIIHISIAIACGIRVLQIRSRLNAARRVLGGRGESGP
jgi:hypothetical protein